MPDEREERSGLEDIEPPEVEEPLEAGEPGSNLITPAGFKKLKDEREQLTTTERPPVAARLAELSAKGVQPEDEEYVAGKKRLKEIDKRLRFLNRRLELAGVVDPAKQDKSAIGFGAIVVTQNESEQKKVYHIVGEDEVDVSKGKISWKSPIARGLMDAQKGDWVSIELPNGTLDLCITSIKYEA